MGAGCAGVKVKWIWIPAVALLAACGQILRDPSGDPHPSYSAALFMGSSLVLQVFPSHGEEFYVRVPAGGQWFSADGRVVYRIGDGVLSAYDIKDGKIRVLTDITEFRRLEDIAVTATGDKAVISGTYGHDDKARSGLFLVDFATREVTFIVEQMGHANDYLTSWIHFSVSPDGHRLAGTAQKGQIGIVNLTEHKVEKLWSGTNASISPDGRWIAATDFTASMNITLIDLSDFSKQRSLGSAGRKRPVWSPDSRYLLVWKSELWCIMGFGYFGTLEELDIQTGVRTTVTSSRCKVNTAGAFWVNNEDVRFK